MPEKVLKPYMAYCGQQPEEAAVLVVAYTAKEAKALAWPVLNADFGVCDGWLDLVVRRIELQHLALANHAKVAAGEPHCVDDPAHCVACGFWGCGIDDDGFCSECGEYAGDNLFTLYRPDDPLPWKEAGND